jgi:hypothetical protein
MVMKPRAMKRGGKTKPAKKMMAGGMAPGAEMDPRVLAMLQAQMGGAPAAGMKKGGATKKMMRGGAATKPMAMKRGGKAKKK